MPLYQFNCPKCKRPSKRILTVEEYEARGLKCRWHGCDGVLTRDAQPPTTHNKEVIHQPHQVKDIERFSDVEKLMQERDKKDYRKPE